MAKHRTKQQPKAAAPKPALRVRPHLAPVDVAQRYEILEAAAYLRISRAKLYQLISSGEVRTLHEGSRHYVPGSEIVRRSTLQPAT